MSSRKFQIRNYRIRSSTRKFISLHILYSVFCTLYSSECVLRLVTNVKFLQFSDKILEHMRMFMDPEKLVALNLWENDTEEWIASGLLDLLHLLPWLPSGNSSAPPVQDPHPAGGTVSAKQVLRTFLYNFATTVSDLDMVWRKFRPSASSPFIYPFAKFLTRYPVEAVKFFFSAERILDQEVSVLFQLSIDPIKFILC